MGTLKPKQAKRFYDRFGDKQDRQAFYEDPATELMIALGDFGNARSVFELGCGTGRLARTLLCDHLPAAATYQAVDISSTMVALAEQKLSEFSPRASVSQLSVDERLPADDASADRFVATYVFDLLSEDAIDQMLHEARRVLEPGGLLCVAGITPGTTVLSKIVSAGWKGLFRLNSRIVGGCRPIRMIDQLDADEWAVEQHQVVIAYGIASEVLIAGGCGSGSRPSAPS